MKLKHWSRAFPGAIVLLVIFFFAVVISTFTGPVAVSAQSENTEAPQARTLKFNTSAGGLIPDAPNCLAVPGPPRNMTLNVSGFAGPPTDISVEVIFDPPHSFMGDIVATLIAPNGSSFVLFGRTGAISASGTGDNSDLNNLYRFSDAATAPPSGGWWQHATVQSPTSGMQTGTYFTTAMGGAGQTNPAPATSLNAAFAGLPTPNGSWVLRVTDGCAGDTGGVSFASLSITGVVSDYTRGDFDGDGRTNLAVYRPSEGRWYITNPQGNPVTQIAWGLGTDLLAPGDFDGDGRADAAIFRPDPNPVNPDFYILNSATSSFTAISWGDIGDIPVVGDYDGDDRADAAIYRPSTNTWWVRGSGGGQSATAFGAAGDLVVRGDYDGDRKTDIAVYRGGQWWIAKSTGGVTVLNFGLATDKAVPADYDGDDIDDIAVYRPSTGRWYILRSSTGVLQVVQYGFSTDVPVPGDYNGDGLDEPAVYRDGTWYMSAAGQYKFGVGSDIPIPTKYIP